MEKSEKIDELAKALSDFQGEMGSVGFDANNPFFKSKYATLAAIVASAKTFLSKHGLCVSQLATLDGGVTTILMHDSGQFIADTLKLTPVKNDPQGMGSAITYARRYAYASILGIVADEDDDGNAETHVRQEIQKPQSTRQEVPSPKWSSVKHEIVDTPKQPVMAISYNHVINLGKLAFKDPQKFIDWLGFNYGVEKASELSQEQIKKATNELNEVIGENAAAKLKV